MATKVQNVSNVQNVSEVLTKDSILAEINKLAEIIQDIPEEDIIHLTGYKYRMARLQKILKTENAEIPKHLNSLKGLLSLEEDI